MEPANASPFVHECLESVNRDGNGAIWDHVASTTTLATTTPTTTTRQHTTKNEPILFGEILKIHDDVDNHQDLFNNVVDL